MRVVKSGGKVRCEVSLREGKRCYECGKQEKQEKSGLKTNEVTHNRKRMKEDENEKQGVRR